MLSSICPKLPMRDKTKTLAYYTGMGFNTPNGDRFDDYLMLQRDQVEIHFFLFAKLNAAENYGQVYIRVQDIDTFYQSLVDAGHSIHPNAPLQLKPWGQKEFSLLDPDNNLLTFGESI
ncbi:MAG: VOC family protein [Chitinophagaceae bacterium]|nr:VOC family protein [Chitinophagaceae bacterium]